MNRVMLRQALEGGRKGWKEGPRLIVNADNIVFIRERDDEYHKKEDGSSLCVVHFVGGESLEVMESWSDLWTKLGR